MNPEPQNPHPMKMSKRGHQRRKPVQVRINLTRKDPIGNRKPKTEQAAKVLLFPVARGPSPI